MSTLSDEERKIVRRALRMARILSKRIAQAIAEDNAAHVAERLNALRFVVDNASFDLWAARRSDESEQWWTPERITKLEQELDKIRSLSFNTT